MSSRWVVVAALLAAGCAGAPVRGEDDSPNRKKLLALSVVKRLPQFKLEDAQDLAKVEAAFKAATFEMLVRTLPGNDAEWEPVALASALSPSPAICPPTQEGLQRHGGSLTLGTAADGKASFEISECRDRQLAVGDVPALVWAEKQDKKDRRLIIVTADGGRYAVHAKGLEPGAPRTAPWPRSPHAILQLAEIRRLAEAGQGFGALARELEEFDARADMCQRTFVSQEDAEHRALDAAEPDAAKRKARHQEIARKFRAEWERNCGPISKSLEDALVAALGERQKARDKVYAAAAWLAPVGQATPTIEAAPGAPARPAPTASPTSAPGITVTTPSSAGPTEVGAGEGSLEVRCDDEATRLSARGITALEFCPVIFEHVRAGAYQLVATLPGRPAAKVRITIRPGQREIVELGPALEIKGRPVP